MMKYPVGPGGLTGNNNTPRDYSYVSLIDTPYHSALTDHPGDSVSHSSLSQSRWTN